MIPSDHFVRFYNEIFKFLEARGEEALQQYYATISRHQEIHTLAMFQKDGLKGMYDYWSHIRFEENCELELELHDDCLIKRMKKCPSLTKVLDNDASPCRVYCNHCPGWVLPVLEKAGYVAQYDLINHAKPCCVSVIYPASSGKKSSVIVSEEGEVIK